MPEDLSPGYLLPAPTLNDPWGLGAYRIGQLRDRLAVVLRGMIRNNAGVAQRVVVARGVAVPAIAAGASVDVAVVFPVPADGELPAFTGAPAVFVQGRVAARLTRAVTAVSATGFTLTCDNWSPDNASASSFDWMAVGS